MNVRITERGGRVVLQSPYNPALPARAKRIGGRYDGNTKTWQFDPRDLDRVRELARDVYGTDGTPTETVTVRHTVSESDALERELWLYGRLIAQRRGRDEAVRLGDGVIIVEGRFLSWGGSIRNPALGGAGVVLEIRDVPRALVTDETTIVTTGTGPDQAALRARIAEPEAELASLRARLTTNEEG